MAVTTKFMGSGQLVDRLAAQLSSSGMKGDTKAAALDILKKRGQMTASGKFTEAGAARNAMTAEERAIDRAKKRSGAPASDFKYNPKTNRATRR